MTTYGCLMTARLEADGIPFNGNVGFSLLRGTVIYGLFPQSVQHHVRLAYAQALLVGIEVSARHACQQDFLVVTAGEYFVFISQEVLLSLHIR